MPNPTPTPTETTPPVGTAPSSFATRRADREARAAAGEKPPERRHIGFRAGLDAENPILTVTHVRA
jgi:hypothetical protein